MRRTQTLLPMLVARDIKPSPSTAASNLARSLRAQGRDILDLAVGEPGADTPEHIKQAAVAAIAAGETKYTPVNGTPALRSAIIDKFRARTGVRAGDDHRCSVVDQHHVRV